MQQQDKTFSALRNSHIVELTCGPTTPEGPGGPVFPWNPCSPKERWMEITIWCVVSVYELLGNLPSLTGSPL